MPNLQRLSVFSLSLLILVTAPAVAQTPDATTTAKVSTALPPPPAADAQPGDATTVTIFAKRRPESVRAFSQISAKSASSCSFQVADGASEAVLDSYLSDMGYDNGTLTNQPPAVAHVHPEGLDLNNTDLADPRTGTTLTDPSVLRPRINDRAVFGDASQTTGDMGQFNPDMTGNSINMTGASSGFNSIASTPGGCTVADGQASAARNFIARVDTTFKEGMAAYEAKDYPKAIGLFERNYNKLGYPEAALMIADIYLNGRGVAADTGKAIGWLKKVAESTMPDFDDRQRFDPADPYAIDGRNRGIMTLARLYMIGRYGIARDDKEARRWLSRADQGGYIPATYQVGLMFESGYGGEKNAYRAVTFFQRAGEAGFAPAQYHLGQLYYSGADGVAVDKTKAGAWLLKAAQTGYPDALYAVARMYQLGEGGAQADVPKALVYYKEAAVKGQIDAQVTLATYFYTGEGGAPKDAATARKLFEAAAQQGDPDAMFNLAVMLANGEGGAKDVARAYAWFTLSAQNGLDKAKAAQAELAGKMTVDERARADALLKPTAAK